MSRLSRSATDRPDGPFGAFMCRVILSSTRERRHGRKQTAPDRREAVALGDHAVPGCLRASEPRSSPLSTRRSSRATLREIRLSNEAVDVRARLMRSLISEEEVK